MPVLSMSRLTCMLCILGRLHQQMRNASRAPCRSHCRWTSCSQQEKRLAARCTMKTSSQPTDVHAAGNAAAAAALQRFGLQNVRCLVTGGTKGIGEAIVEELASLGAKVLDLLRLASLTLSLITMCMLACVSCMTHAKCRSSCECIADTLWTLYPCLCRLSPVPGIKMSLMQHCINGNREAWMCK